MKKGVVVQIKTAMSHKPPTLAEQVKAKMADAFNGIFRNAAETSPHSPGGRLPQYGPYGLQILYGVDGAPKHLVGCYIDQLRLKRPFTKNAIEVRCDALGLAIYVSGNPELSSDGSLIKRNVRIVVFQKDALQPSYQKVASSSDDLTEKLHGILVSTYNQLAHDYNLAGFQLDWLVLRCPSGALPEIPVSMAASG